jgi:hypothetical protein
MAHGGRAGNGATQWLREVKGAHGHAVKQGGTTDLDSSLTVFCQGHFFFSAPGIGWQRGFARKHTPPQAAYKITNIKRRIPYVPYL